MALRKVSEKVIRGISVRTNNAAEFGPNGKIPALWQSFDESVPVDYQNGERVYGVYYNYESDHNGMFNVLAGFDGQSNSTQTNIENVVIPEGQYLVFTQTGDMPQIAIDAWTQVWEYFTNESTEYERCFSTDFEYYPNEKTIEVHIAVQEPN